MLLFVQVFSRYCFCQSEERVISWVFKQEAAVRRCMLKSYWEKEFNFAKKGLHSKFYRIYILLPGVCLWAQIDYFFHNKHLSRMLKWLFPLVSQFFTEICWKREGGIPQSWEIKCRSTQYLHCKKYYRIIILFGHNFDFNEISVLINFEFCLLFVFHLLCLSIWLYFFNYFVCLQWFF